MAISKKLPAAFSIYYFLSIGVLFLLISTARIELAGRFLTLILALYLIYSVISNRHPLHFTMVFISFSPFLAYLRQYVISYNGVLMILIGIFSLWAVFDQKVFLKTLTYKLVWQISLFLAVLILYGVLIGTNPLRFGKFIETILTIMTFSMALFYADKAKKYFKLIVFSSITLTTSLLPFQGTRFVIESEGQIYGADPSSFSIALVLSVILIWADKGMWTELVGKTHSSKIRTAIFIILLALIILSTSRVGVFTVLGVILIYMFILRLPPKKLITFAIAIFAVVLFIMNSKFSVNMDYWMNKTFYNVRGVDVATSGRTYQWKMAGQYLLTDNPLTILTGYGPGNGPDFNQKYSMLIPAIKTWRGSRYELHSLYLNILVEFGLLAFILFLVFVIKALKRNYYLFKRTGYAISFLSGVGYLIYISSVSGLGIVAGTLVAFAVIRPENLTSLKAAKKGVNHVSIRQ